MRGAMTQCPSCHSAHHGDSRFCPRCGAARALQCRRCAAANEPKARFCGNCGWAFPTASSLTIPGAPRWRATEAPYAVFNRVERRSLTVMFCDLVNSTRLASSLDPEDTHLVICKFQRVCAAVIHSHNGFVAQCMGDGIMIYFGYPRAREEDAERSVHAAMDLIASIKSLKIRLSKGPALNIAIRIGIATGPVVVSGMNGASGAAGQAMAGEPLNLAARLQGQAAPGTVIISPGTRDLVKNHFELKDIGERPLRGFEKPQRLWQVVAVANAKTCFQTPGRAKAARLEGRSEALARLLRQWRLARQGQGQAALICGETGSGKSTLIEAARAQLGELALSDVHRCSPCQGRHAPLRAQLAGSLGLAREDSSEVIKEQTWAALTKRMERLSEPQCMLLAMEDLHWMDAASIERLNGLLPLLKDRPALLILSHRPDFEAPAAWLRHRHVETISLAPLNNAEAERVVRQLAKPRFMPSRLVAEIVDKSDGVPLFIEELTKAALRARADAAASRPGEIAMPETLRPLLMAQLDLRPLARETAQVGAALGREFPYALLARVWRHKREKLDFSLRSLCEAGVLIKLGNGDSPHYAFRRALVQQAAYQSLLKSVRRKLRGRISQALAMQHPLITINKGDGQ